MSKQDYVEVGGILTTKKGKKYECVELIDAFGCGDCSFHNSFVCNGVKCIPSKRADDKNVMFKRRKDLEQPTTSIPDTQVAASIRGSVVTFLVGAKIELSDGVYVVKPAMDQHSCAGCDLNMDSPDCLNINCHDRSRTDKTSVIFVKERK